MSVLAGRIYATRRDEIIDRLASLRTVRRISGDTMSPTGTFEIVHIRPAEVPSHYDADAFGPLAGHYIVTRDTSGVPFIGTFDKRHHAEEEFERLEARFQRWVKDDSECEKCEIGSGRHGGDCTLYGMADRKAEHRKNLTNSPPKVD